MKKKALLRSSDRTRIASVLYKLAIRVMNMSKRPLDPAKVGSVLNRAQEGSVKKLIEDFSPPEGGLAISKPPSIQKVLATRTTVPSQGDGIRVDYLFGPFFCVENNGEPEAVGKKTVMRPGLSPENTYSSEKIEEEVASAFGGALPQFKFTTVDVRDRLDRPFRLDVSYDKGLGRKAFKILHTAGPQKGQIALYENPRILGQMAKNPELDPWVPAVFRTAEEAAQVLNELTRGTSLGSRSFPKFKEYTRLLKYSAVYLKSPVDGNSSLYNIFDILLSEADSVSDEVSSKDQQELLNQAMTWLDEQAVSPAALMSTLEAKNPEMAKQLKPLLPVIQEKWQRDQERKQEKTIGKITALIRERKLNPTAMMSLLNAKNPDMLRSLNKIMPSPDLNSLLDKVKHLFPAIERAYDREPVKEQKAG